MSNAESVFVFELEFEDAPAWRTNPMEYPVGLNWPPLQFHIATEVYINTKGPRTPGCPVALGKLSSPGGSHGDEEE